MIQILKPVLGKFALVYIDDILIYARTPDELIDNLQEVINLIRKAGLKLKPKKCEIFAEKLSFLGHDVSAKGIEPLNHKVEAIKSWPAPTNVKEVITFVSLCSYYRKFVKNFAAIAFPLTRMTKKDSGFRWGIIEQEAFNVLKDKLTSAPVLVFHNPEKKCLLDCDASGNAIGFVLSQYDLEIGVSRTEVLAYGSKALSDSKRKYDPYRRELLAIVFFTRSLDIT